jgi:hypothetical protein
VRQAASGGQSMSLVEPSTVLPCGVWGLGIWFGATDTGGLEAVPVVGCWAMTIDELVVELGRE